MDIGYRLSAIGYCTYCTYFKYCEYCIYCTLTGDARRRVDTWARVQFQLFPCEGDSNDQDDQERPGTAHRDTSGQTERDLRQTSTQIKPGCGPCQGESLKATQPKTGRHDINGRAEPKTNSQTLKTAPATGCAQHLQDRLPRIRNSRTRVRRCPTRLPVEMRCAKQTRMRARDHTGLVVIHGGNAVDGVVCGQECAMLASPLMISPLTSSKTGDRGEG